MVDSATSPYTLPTTTETAAKPARIRIRKLKPRPFACSFPGCLKSFSSSNARQTHANTHTKTKPHGCKFCSASFTDPSSRNRHENEVHGKRGYRTYKCDICQTTIVRSTSFARHMKQQHNIVVSTKLDRQVYRHVKAPKTEKEDSFDVSKAQEIMQESSPILSSLPVLSEPIISFDLGTPADAIPPHPPLAVSPASSPVPFPNLMGYWFTPQADPWDHISLLQMSPSPEPYQSSPGHIDSVPVDQYSDTSALNFPHSDVYFPQPQMVASFPSFLAC